MEQIEEEQRMGMLDGQRAMLRRIVRAHFRAVPARLDQYIATADEETLKMMRTCFNGADVPRFCPWQRTPMRLATCDRRDEIIRRRR